jgi:hypothetical protein
MKYMLLIYTGEGCMTDAERTACMVESLRLCDELKARGQFLDAAPLEPVATAATVRVRGGRPLVTDGPFAETVEQLGGYYVLDLPDLDAAIAVAARLPPVTRGTVEIRPVATLDGLPPARPHAVEGGAAPYLLLLYHDKNLPEKTPAEQQEGAAKAVAFARELDAAGAYASAAPLHPAETATSVRVRDGKRLITDGPFAETNEVLGGYFLIRAGSRDEAVRVAARFRGGCSNNAVEVRPLADLSAAREIVAADPRPAVDSAAARSTVG